MSASREFRIEPSSQIVPGWTQLPALALRGVGTAEVESLQHYYGRLIWTTRITTLHLRRYINKHAQIGADHSSSFCRALILGPAAGSLLGQLQMLTGVDDLRYGTLWALSEVVSRNCSLFGAHKRRWCPECYANWDNNQSYEPLVWSIDLLGCCPKHNCDLEYACPKCHSYQREASRPDQRRICWVCKASLAQGARWRSRPTMMQWMDEQVIQLVEYCATPRSAPMPWMDYVTFVSGVRSNARKNGALQGSMRQLLQSVDKRARRYSRRPSIRTLFNLCCLQGISVRELLNAPKEASSPLLLDHWASASYMPLPPIVQVQRIYMAVRYLEDFLGANPPYLPPIDLLLKPFKVENLAVRDASAGLFDQYESRYLAQGTSDHLAVLRKTFLCALHASHQRFKGSESSKVDLAEMAGSGGEAASKVFSAYLLVRAPQRLLQIEQYRKELPIRESLKWLLERRSMFAHRC